MQKNPLIKNILSKLEELVFLYTDKSFGNMSSNVGDTSNNIQNRSKVLNQLPPGKRNVCITALHTDKIINADTVPPDDNAQPGLELYKCDALFADTKNANIWILPADCIPLILYTAGNTACGLVHISRKTIETELLKKSLAEFTQLYQIPFESVKVHLGPGVHKEHYIFPADTAKDLFGQNWQPFLYKTDDGDVYVDLQRRTLSELELLGVTKQEITTDQSDTANGRYFSQSKGREDSQLQGRNAAIVFTTR